MNIERLRRVALPTALCAASAWFGNGLHPCWAITWLIPCFGFLAATPLTGWRRLLPGAVAVFAGGLSEWSYLSFLPAVVRILLLLIPAVAFGGCTALFGALASRGRTWLALTIPAAAFVSYEYVYSTLSPHSTFGALAYTQVNCLPILQLSTLGGIWLIDGLIFLVASGVALLVVAGPGPVKRLRIALVTLVPLAVALLFGFVRLRSGSTGMALRVGLLASDRRENMWFGETGTSEGILRRYLAQIPPLAKAGADLVLLPEHLFWFRESAPDVNAPELERLLKQCAADNRVRIVLGVDRFDAQHRVWNEARVYSPDGTVTTYDKHHLLPGLEGRCIPGTAYTTLPDAGQLLGLAICKDLDFPSTGRAYARRQIGALIVPAFDFTADGWLHCRMAVTRAVESGFALVRSAKLGLLTVADNRGRILAETSSADGEFAHLAATVPVQFDPTPYARLGDWFAWLCCAGVLALPLAFKRHRSSPK